MSFSRSILWYHSQAGPVWPDGTFNAGLCFYFTLKYVLFIAGLPIRSWITILGAFLSVKFVAF